MVEKLKLKLQRPLAATCDSIIVDMGLDNRINRENSTSSHWEVSTLFLHMYDMHARSQNGSCMVTLSHHDELRLSLPINEHDTIAEEWCERTVCTKCCGTPALLNQ